MLSDLEILVRFDCTLFMAFHHSLSITVWMCVVGVGMRAGEQTHVHQMCLIVCVCIYAYIYL